jgi:VanZ family protein
LPGSEPWRTPRPAPEIDELRARIPRKSMIPAWLRTWWPALLWSLIIFTASTDSFSSQRSGSILWPVLHWLVPSLTDSQFEIIHLLIRKSAHVTEYFIFFLLLFRGIRGGRHGWHWAWAFAAWFIAAAYSALDEIHQSFVVSRTASPWDSLLDSTGAFIALLVVYFYYRPSRRPPLAKSN